MDGGAGVRQDIDGFGGNAGSPQPMCSVADKSPRRELRHDFIEWQ
jgi:hypothetical protein